MNRRLQALLVAMAAIAAVAGMTAFILNGNEADRRRDRGVPDFKTFTAADAHFRADFPGRPQRSEQEVPAGTSSLKLIQYTSDIGDNRGFSVGWFRLAAAPEANAVRSFLEATQRGSVAAVQGQLVTTTFVQQDGHEAIEYLAKLRTGGYVKSRTVLVGSDVYVLQVVGPQSDPEHYAQFVESFDALPAQ